MVKTKLIYIIGSIIIGFISIVGVFFGLTASGVISTEQARVVIATASAEKEYDGTALLCQEWSIVDGKLKDGHVANVVITATATDVGEYENYAAVTITDHVGADVTDDYKLEVQLGKLTVHKRRMTLQSETAEKVYDGDPLEMGTVTVLDDKLVKGHVVRATKKETPADVGSYQNLFTATILDEKERDVTHNYELTYGYGTLEIKPRKITVTTEDINKVYDGIALTASKGVLSTKTPLVEGQRMVSTPNATIKNAGEVENAVLVSIFWDGEDVTDNYEINYKYGKLTVAKRSITIATKDGEKVYDGKELKHEEYYVYDETPLADGDEIEPNFLGKLTNVGTLENTVEVEIKTSEERVTDNYEITYVFGTLTVKPRPLILWTGSADKVYDGEPLYCNEWEFVDGTSVVEGQTYEVQVTGALTNAGKAFNEAKLTIMSEENIDAIGNYAVETRYGELTVKLRPLKIFTESNSKTYDGEPLTAKIWEFIEDTSVADGQTYDVDVIGTLTDVGSTTNTVNITITDKNGLDAKSNYDISTAYGILTVTKRPLTIETGSYEKNYDATPLTYGDWDYVNGTREANSQILVVEVIGTITNAGTAENLAIVTVYSKDNVNVTDNYELSVIYGNLTVKKLPLEIQTGTYTKMYDGKPLVGDTWELLNNTDVLSKQNLIVEVKGVITNVGSTPNYADVYIEDENGINVKENYDVQITYGTLNVTKRILEIETGAVEKVYDGTPLTNTEWDYLNDTSEAENQTLTVTVTGTITNVGEVDNEVVITIVDENNVDVKDNYDIQITCGKLRVTKRPFYIQTGTDEKVYDGMPLTCNTWEYLDDTSVADGQVAEVDITGTLTDVGALYNNYATVQIFDKYNVNVTKNYDVQITYGTLTVTKRPLKIQTGDAEKAYDGLALTCSDVEFLDDTSVSAIQTYTIDITGTLTDAGTTKNWFTITIKDDRNVTVNKNYEIEYVYGTLEITKLELEFETYDDEKVYDGKPLTNTAWTLVSGTYAPGQILDVTVTGTRTAVGETENTLQCIIYDATGKEEVTHNYIIRVNSGTLTVKKRPLEITTYDGEKVYDGTPLTNTAWDCINGTSVPTWQTLTVTVTGTITNAGQVNNAFTYSIVDENGDRVSLSNYDVQVTYGTLTVTKIYLSFETYSAEKVYDGTPLTFDSWSILVGQVAPNQTFIPNVLGSQTNYGYSNNYANPIVIDADNQDVTRNYDIDTAFGILTVTKRSLEIQTGSAEKYYDGIALSCKQVEYLNDTSVADGQTIDITYKNSLTNAGRVDNAIDVVIMGENGEIVTRNYDITVTNGTLRVMKRIIRLSTGSDSKTYDGLPLTKDEYTLLFDPATASEGENLAFGHTLDVKVLGTLTEVGSVPNIADVRIFMGDVEVTDNYTIYIQEGRLTVAKRILTITTEGLNKVYDGEPISNEKYDCVGTLIDGHELKITFLNSKQTEVGSYKNKISAYVFVGEEDVTYNYEINVNEGDLTITKRAITVRSSSAEKDYDGTPLRDDKWEVVSINQVIDGHVLEVVVSGEQLSVGSSKNDFGQILVFKEVEPNVFVDVTSNYAIEKQCGTLTVKGTNSNNPGGGGGIAPPSGGLQKGDESGDELVCLEVYSEVGGSAYLRYTSYGAYEGQQWAAAKEYTQLLDDKYSYNYLFSIALENAKVKSNAMEIKDYTGAYYLPYYTQRGLAGYQIQSSDVVYYGEANSHYSLYYYTYDFAKLGLDGLYGVNLGSYTALANEYEQFVRNNYLSMPVSTRQYFTDLIAAQNFDKNDPQIISKVAKYIQGAAKYNKDYPDAMDNESDIAVSFLETYKEGVCRHYASAATLLFRALGIPARYAEGFLADTKANAWTEVKGKQAHAWVEVYVSGYGWVQVEVTGSDGNGENGNGDGENGDGENGDGETSSLLKMEITPVKVAVQSNGSNYAEAINEVTGGKVFSDLLKYGYKYEVDVSGRQTTFGKGKSTVNEFKLYNPVNKLVYHYRDGEELVNEENFDIAFKNGIVHLYIETLTFTSGSYSKTYDGSILTPEDDYSWVGSLQSGHSLEKVEFTGKQLNAGKTSNTFTVKIVDEAGQDVTSWYNVVKKYGTLTVFHRHIELTAGSKTFTYDGEVKRYEYFEITSEQGVAEGQAIMAKMEENCYLESYGAVTNVIDVNSIVITDEAGMDVTSNYIIDTKDGMLIMPIE